VELRQAVPRLARPGQRCRASAAEPLHPVVRAARGRGKARYRAHRAAAVARKERGQARGQALLQEVRPRGAQPREAPAGWAAAAAARQGPGVAWVALAERLPEGAASVAAVVRQPEAALAEAEGRPRVAAVPVAAEEPQPAEQAEEAAQLPVAQGAARVAAEVPRQGEAAAEVRDAAALRPAARGGPAVPPWAPASAVLPWIRRRSRRPARLPAEAAPRKKDG